MNNLFRQNMKSTYIPRSLFSGSKTYSESDLISQSQYIVILAEAGAGKTDLLQSIAAQLSVRSISANVFSAVNNNQQESPLVIDAFDEFCRLDPTGIYKILAKAQDLSPTHIIISSRSSEWGQVETQAFQEIIGKEPLVVRLCEFQVDEQRSIFESYVQGEDFSLFYEEVNRFDLAMLLSNPQFLKLFADAYVESGRKFTDKPSIFIKAVERLAKEVNPKLAASKISIEDRIQISSEIFAKLLLSGSEGISTNEALETPLFPYIKSLTSGTDHINHIIGTRLFKSGDELDQHCHIHKIVAEYCAASYLTKRIIKADDPLTIYKCLPIIAPNGIVREELRGLIGWMATLGGKDIQQKIIGLDPYSVLAYGDPSQLENSSKKLLVTTLKSLEDTNPYFRRCDFSRNFSMAGFFTPDFIEIIKPILKTDTGGHLRNLLLELLVGSPITNCLVDDLKDIILNSKENEHTRFLSCRCLIDLNNNLDNYLDALIAEKTNISLHIATEIIEKIGSDNIERSILLAFFQSAINLYPQSNHHFDDTKGSRYFIKGLISTLNNVELIEWLLEELTKELKCICRKEYYACECRIGISKIVGSLLDRYFELSTPPFDPIKVWRWIENLHFDSNSDISQIKSVQVLQSDHVLRQGILVYIFGCLTTYDEITQTKFYLFDCNGLIKQDTLNGSIYTASRGVYESNKDNEKADL